MRCSKYRVFQLVIFSVLSLVLTHPAQAFDADLWQKLQDGKAVALLRHALAPGNGDPVEFNVDDCATQRNLSPEGVAQADRIGALFRAQGIAHADVYSSQWCRCIDTANELNLGTVIALPLLNSFYQDRSTQRAQTDKLKQWIEKRLENRSDDTTLPAVMVSHQVNITSLTNVYPSSGEIVIVGYQDANLVVLGTLETR